MLRRLVLPLAVICGILDATAVWNTATFGIGAYIAVSGTAGALLILRSFRLGVEQARDGIPISYLNPMIFAIALMWAFASLHASLQIGADPMTLITQTTVRSILFGHFLICILLIRIVADQVYLTRILCVFMLVYLCYGLYDFGAQILHLPRFLDFMRNNNSEKAVQAMGPQGWIQLPRIMGFAAEPSHSLMPLALATFIFAQLRGYKRIALITLTVIFCAGTFARSVWIAYVGAACLALAFWASNRLFGRTQSWLNRALLAGTALLLPLIVLSIPLFTNVSPDADSSVMKRVDSSRAGVTFFSNHPLTGVGFEGWKGRPIGFGDQPMFPEGVDYIHNGVSVYLAAFGVAGILLAYLPLLLIIRAPGLSFPSKGYWIGIYCLSALGGEYLALPSTWTAIAIAVTWVSVPALAHRRTDNPALEIPGVGAPRPTN